MTQKYLVVIEKTKTGYSAFAPDIPGCIATGHSREEVEINMKESMEFHLEGLHTESGIIPMPKSYSREVEMTI